MRYRLQVDVHYLPLLNFLNISIKLGISFSWAFAKSDLYSGLQENVCLQRTKSVDLLSRFLVYSWAFVLPFSFFYPLT
jgi:hypothetical protein